MTLTKTNTKATTGPPAAWMLILACACASSDDDSIAGDSDDAGSGDTVTSATDAAPTDGSASADNSGTLADGSTADSGSGDDSSGTPGEAVELGSAGDFVVLAKTGISVVPPGAITGDVGVSPAAATFITGFDLVADATNVFATSTQVTGRVYAADYLPPTPSAMTAAVSDMELAFTDAAGRAPDVTELGGGDIGGMTLAPGIYAWSSGLSIPTDLVLEGSATDVWIFQIAQDLTIASATSIALEGGALAERVIWQVAGRVELGTTAHAEGIVLSQTSITLGTGASIDGRLFAQTAVSLDGNAVVAP